MNLNISYEQIRTLVIEYYKDMISKMGRFTLNGAIRCDDKNVNRGSDQIFIPTSPIRIIIPVLVDKKYSNIIEETLDSNDIKKILINRLNLRKDKYYKHVMIDEDFWASNRNKKVINSASIVYANPKVKIKEAKPYNNCNVDYCGYSDQTFGDHI